MFIPPRAERVGFSYAAGRASPERVSQRVEAFRAYTKHCSAEKTTKHVLQDLERRAVQQADAV